MANLLDEEQEEKLLSTGKVDIPYELDWGEVEPCPDCGSKAQERDYFSAKALIIICLGCGSEEKVLRELDDDRV